MKKGCLVTIGILSILFLWIMYTFFHLYDNEYETLEIKQKIGGILICNSTLYNDIHDWEYHVKYEYKFNNKKILIGQGIYKAREWNKDEQLIKFNDWHILKTGESYGTEKILIGKLKNSNWKSIEFIPETIEKDSLWKSLKIKSLLNYCCGETKVSKIENGKIEVEYKYRIDEKKTDLYNKKKLFYEIDSNSGNIILKKIK